MDTEDRINQLNIWIFKMYFYLKFQGPSVFSSSVTESPLTAAALDQTIAAFDTVEDLLKHLNPESWQEDLDSLYSDTAHLRPRSFHHERKQKSKGDFTEWNNRKRIQKEYKNTHKNHKTYYK